MFGCSRWCSQHGLPDHVGCGRTILTNVQALTGGQLMRMPKQPPRDLWQKLRENWTVHPIHITVTMQINTFADERMKTLYVLSLMSGGMAQVWQPIETSVTLAKCPCSTPSKDSWCPLKNTFRDPDRKGCTTQLHATQNDARYDQEEYMANLRCSQKDQLQQSSPGGCHIRGLPNQSFWRSTLRHPSHPAWTTGRQLCAT